MSQCEQFVARAQKRLAAHDEERVRLVSELQEGESRLARLREAATVARDVPVPQPVQPEAGVQVARLEEMVKVLQDERDAGVPSPGKPLRIVNIGRGEDQRVDQCPLPGRWRQGRQIVFSTRHHRAQDQCGAERFDRARCKKKSSVERTNHIHGGQQGQLSKGSFCFDDAQVDGEHGGSRLPVARRITTWGLRGVRVGEASHPGQLRRHMSRPIEGRDVTPRMHPAAGATQVDEDSDVLDVTHVSQRPRRGRRRVSSDSDVPLVRGSRFAVLTESDDESDPLIRPTGQTRNEDDVNTVPSIFKVLLPRIWERLVGMPSRWSST